MISHNAGKINWNIIRENIHWTTKSNKNKFMLKDENTKPIEFLSKQIFNLIKEFAETPQKNHPEILYFQNILMKI